MIPTMSSRATTPTPAPMPAFAPVDSPLLGSVLLSVVFVAVGAGAMPAPVAAGEAVCKLLDDVDVGVGAAVRLASTA